MLFFDEDCNARYYYSEAGTMLPKDLDHIVDDLKNTDVKSMVIGTGGASAMYPGAKAVNEYIAGFEMEKGLDQPWFCGKPSVWSYRNAANIVVLRNMGCDSNAYLLQRAREKNMAAWITIRMNDQHGTWVEKSPGHSQLWMDHPEMRTQTCAPQSGLSFEHPQVREMMFNVIKENLELYDVDGIILDWMRHVPHFNDGEGEKNIPAMNEFIRSVKEMVDEFAVKRGHKILIAPRVPATVASARYHGLDAVEWAKRGYIDRIIISPKYLRSYILDPGAWKEAVGKADFPVTACIDTPHQPYPGYPSDAPAGAWTKEPFDNRQLPFIRGACRVALGNGSDGIYLFNFMNIRNKKKMMEIFQECGTLESLRGKNFSIDISYDDLHMDEPDFLKGWRAGSNDAYFSIWRKNLKDQGIYPYQLPQELSSGASCKFTFVTGEVPEKDPQIAFSFEGLGDAEVEFNGIKCVLKDGRYLLPVMEYSGKEAVIKVTNKSDESVVIERASMHFSWNGEFPELFDPAKKITIGVAADI
ncbi:MAG: hypothetical protein E7043_07835 [Lentisphaerae bacterium]|nr:hypothetical protein [Lentisphaerota bacterium]